MRHKLLSDSALQTYKQLAKYLVGALLAFGVDVTVYYLCAHFGLATIICRAAGLLSGVTTTYFFNRKVTFSPTRAASLGDWSRYVAGQSVGTSINFMVSTGLLYWLGKDGWRGFAALFVGAGVGFIVNFFSARRNLHR